MSPRAIDLLAAGPLLVVAGVAGWALKAAWRERGAWRPVLILLGWAAIAVALIGAGVVLGPAKGVFMAAPLVSVAVLALVASGVQIRATRSRGERSLAPEPSDRASKAWRGWLRAVLAGPLGMFAAMGVAICWTVWVPGAPQTRMVIGGLMVPVLWGGAMAWTLADDKILRATAVLAGVTVATFAAAVLKGFS